MQGTSVRGEAASQGLLPAGVWELSTTTWPAPCRTDHGAEEEAGDVFGGRGRVADRDGDLDYGDGEGEVLRRLLVSVWLNKVKLFLLKINYKRRKSYATAVELHKF